MSRILMIVVAAFAVGSLGACANLGKGKGKAPPPQVIDQPAEPVFKG